MSFFEKKYFRYSLLLLILCLFIPGCSSDKEFKFAFNRKDGETYIQKLSISRERHRGPTDIQMDDTLSEARVICKKTSDGWDIDSQPISRIMYQNGKEVKSPLLALLTEFIITYRLDKDGEIKDVVGYEKVLEAIDSRYPSGVAEGLSSSLDVTTLKQREFSEWGRRIGDFLNKEFSIGDVWEDEKPFILPNGVEMTYKVKTQFKEMVQHKDIKCVLIEQTYDSTGKGMSDLVSDVAESVIKEDGNKKGVSLEGSKVTTSIKGKVTRIIDPSTMNIYKEEAERTINMEMDIPGAGKIPVKMIETRSYEYEYGR